MLKSFVFSNTIRKCSSTRPTVLFLNNMRLFSDDSHDDFKPKAKNPKLVEETDLAEVFKVIEKQIKDHDVMLYMKGTPASPQCGFSLQVVRILNAVGADFSSVNVLQYNSIREGIKRFSKWPTIPQVYVKGEFIGGCDIVTEMFNNGELEKLLKDKKLLT